MYINQISVGPNSVCVPYVSLAESIGIHRSMQMTHRCTLLKISTHHWQFFLSVCQHSIIASVTIVSLSIAANLNPSYLEFIRGFVPFHLSPSLLLMAHTHTFSSTVKILAIVSDTNLALNQHIQSVCSLITH